MESVKILVDVISVPRMKLTADAVVVFLTFVTLGFCEKALIKSRIQFSCQTYFADKLKRTAMKPPAKTCSVLHKSIFNYGHKQIIYHLKRVFVSLVWKYN